MKLYQSYTIHDYWYFSLGLERKKKKVEIHHRRHQQANILNSIFKLNIVRFMHTKKGEKKFILVTSIQRVIVEWVRWRETARALHIFAEARIFNYKSHLPFFLFQFFSAFLHSRTRFEQWIELFFPFRLHGNKWSFLHSEAHISMSCYISIAMYMNRLKKLFILKGGEREI